MKTYQALSGKHSLTGALIYSHQMENQCEVSSYAPTHTAVHSMGSKQTLDPQFPVVSFVHCA